MTRFSVLSLAQLNSAGALVIPPGPNATWMLTKHANTVTPADGVKMWRLCVIPRHPCVSSLPPPPPYMVTLEYTMATL